MQTSTKRSPVHTIMHANKGRSQSSMKDYTQKNEEDNTLAHNSSQIVISNITESLPPKLLNRSFVEPRANSEARAVTNIEVNNLSMTQEIFPVPKIS